LFVFVFFYLLYYLLTLFENFYITTIIIPLFKCSVLCSLFGSDLLTNYTILYLDPVDEGNISSNNRGQISDNEQEYWSSYPDPGTIDSSNRAITNYRSSPIRNNSFISQPISRSSSVTSNYPNDMNQPTTGNNSNYINQVTRYSSPNNMDQPVTNNSPNNMNQPVTNNNYDYRDLVTRYNVISNNINQPIILHSYPNNMDQPLLTINSSYNLIYSNNLLNEGITNNSSSRDQNVNVALPHQMIEVLRPLLSVDHFNRVENLISSYPNAEIQD
jgi:hypothetical protein